MRTQPARPSDWQCGYCERPVPAAVNHKCLEYDKAKSAEPVAHWEMGGHLPDNAVPLIFYDSADRRRRLTLLADTLEARGGRISIQNAALLASDLRDFALLLAASADTHPKDGDSTELQRRLKLRSGVARSAKPRCPTLFGESNRER